MKVDTSLVEGNVGSAISKLQEFVALQNSIELGGELGYDTSQAQADLAAVAAEIQAIDPNISGALVIYIKRKIRNKKKTISSNSVKILMLSTVPNAHQPKSPPELVVTL